MPQDFVCAVCNQRVDLLSHRYIKLSDTDYRHTACDEKLRSEQMHSRKDAPGPKEGS